MNKVAVNHIGAERRGQRRLDRVGRLMFHSLAEGIVRHCLSHFETDISRVQWPRTKQVSLLRLLVAGHHGQQRCRLGQQAVRALVSKQRFCRILQTKRLVEDERRLEIRRNLAINVSMNMEDMDSALKEEAGRRRLTWCR
jgi:hypothetical protein